MVNAEPSPPLSESQALRKSLYLVGSTLQAVDTDGPRLLITSQHKPTLRIPFQRISRIVCGPNTHWRGQAITNCLSRNIPIIWLDRHHHPVGDAHPVHSQKSQTHRVVEHYVDLPQWREHYDNWLRHRRMDLLKRYQRQTGITGKAFNTLKRELVYQERFQSPHGPHLLAACQAATNARLAQEQCQVRYWGYDGQPLELAADLGSLLWVEFSLFQPQVDENAQAGIQRFETWWRRHGHLIEWHMASLNQHLHMAIESWP